MAPQEPLVLVVDDFADARQMYAAWLRSSGYRVREASAVAEALAVAHQERPAAILMDLSMPGIDGLEATRRLKRDPQTFDIPVLVLTGHADARTADAAAAAGCDGFLVKPCPIADVLVALDRLLALGRGPGMGDGA